MKHKIKEVRKEKGLTQEDLANKLQITRQGVSSIENSDSVTLNTLEKVAKALGCYAYELMQPVPKGDVLTFETPEEYETYHDSLAKHVETQEALAKDAAREWEEAGIKYLTMLYAHHVKYLNMDGRAVLFKVAEALTTIDEFKLDINYGNETEKEI